MYVGCDGRTLAPVGLSHADLVALAKWALPGYDAGDLDRLARRLSVDSGGLALIAYEILTAVAAGLDYVGTPKPWPPKNRTLDTALPVELPEQSGRCGQDWRRSARE